MRRQDEPEVRHEPHQQPATATAIDPGRQPFRLLRGEASFINILDAAGAWQLVREAAKALGRPAAASFKHVSPAGAATAGEIDAVMAQTYHLEPTSTGLVTSAYVRARDADPKSSYGDFVDFLRRVVSDGIVAPGHEPGVVATLAAKKNGRFLVVEADPGFRPAVDDLLLGLIVVRCTQSNSVAYLRNGMTLGIGAGQQSRVDCTRLAGAKADTWWLRRHPAVRHLAAGTRIQDVVTEQIRRTAAEGGTLTAGDRAEWLDRLDEVAFVSDGALPFADNVAEAGRHGVRYIAEPGDSIRADHVLAESQRRASPTSAPGSGCSITEPLVYYDSEP